jgi:hypothetical protein
MKTRNNLGILMDHSVAHLIEINSHKKTRTIESGYTFSKKIDALVGIDVIKHKEENALQESYFKKIGENILQYKYVFLFGPTNAKVELHNYLIRNSNFKGVKIILESTDKISLK